MRSDRSPEGESFTYRFALDPRNTAEFWNSERHYILSLRVRQVREGEGARVQVVLDVARLEPRLADLPLRGSHEGRAEDVRGADASVGGAIEDVRVRVDVVHLGAWGEAEPEAGGGRGAVVRTLLDNDVSERRLAYRVGVDRTHQHDSADVRTRLGDIVADGKKGGADLLERSYDIRGAVVDFMGRQSEGRRGNLTL